MPSMGISEIVVLLPEPCYTVTGASTSGKALPHSD